MNSNYCGPGEITNSQEQFECLAMAASSNSWLHQNLLPQHSSQQQSHSTHSLFHHAELPLHAGPSTPFHGMDSHPPLHHHSMHSALHIPADLQPPPPPNPHSQPHLPVQGTANSGRTVGPIENGDAAFVRKVHKADREKLRRDRLNEQFVELAGVLDPDRPKNDKATILGDSVQVVKELRSDVKRLKCEQASLQDESRDLQQEKMELREEKAALKTETEQLQSQLQQRLRGMLPWISIDPTAALMGAPPYPYPMQVPQTPSTSTPPTTTATTATTANEAPQAAPTSQSPVVGPSQFLSLAPPGVYMHPYAMYGARPPEGSHPYMAYPPYAANHSHVERPYAQYPSPMSGYQLVQMQPPQGSPNAAAVPMFRPAPPPYGVPGMALVPPGPTRGPPYPPIHGPQAAASPELQGVETSLQLQTPGGSSWSPASETRSSQGNGESKTPEGVDLELTPPGTKEATSDLGSKPDDMNGAGDSISALSLASKSLSRTGSVALPCGEGELQKRVNHMEQPPMKQVSDQQELNSCTQVSAS